MGVVATIAALTVGAMLIVAGLFKLVDVPGWRAQAADLGAPPTATRIVPWAELTIGVLLVVPVVRPWPAVAAAALLAAFTFLVVARLIDGSRPPCACFGAGANRPLGPLHVARNAVLIGLSVVAAVGA